jgi:hypothetical protein
MGRRIRDCLEEDNDSDRRPQSKPSRVHRWVGGILLILGSLAILVGVVLRIGAPAAGFRFVPWVVKSFSLAPVPFGMSSGNMRGETSPPKETPPSCRH